MQLTAPGEGSRDWERAVNMPRPSPLGADGTGGHCQGWTALEGSGSFKVPLGFGILVFSWPREKSHSGFCF